MKSISNFILPILFLCQYNAISFAQLSPGSTAPDFTVTDIDGMSHNLYDLLDSGKTVYLEFSATWCGPCWSFHNTGAFENVWNEHGPNGTDQARVFFIEADLNTPESCLYGNCSNTWGDWTAGVSFPIVNLTSSNGGNLGSDYQIAYYPTIYAVCPDKRVYEPGQVSSSVLETYINSCDMKESSVVTTEEVCYEDGNGSIDIEVQGGVAPIQYSWSNGANSQDLDNISAGNYTLTMTDNNNVSYEHTVTLNGPSSTLLLSTSYELLDVDCFGQPGSVHLDPLGGSPPYIVEWSDGSVDLIRDDLYAGSYDVTLTDAYGCTVAENYIINEPPFLLMTLQKTDEGCSLANGVIEVESYGGTGIHVFDIGGGPTYDPLFSNLDDGNYTVTVTDVNNCTVSQSIEIFNIPGPEAIAPANLDLPCEGDTIQIDATSSNVSPGTTILWTTDNGHIVSGETTLIPRVDASGNYVLTLSNFQTCNDEAETIINPTPGQPLADAGSAKEINCTEPIATLGSSNSSSGSQISYLWKNENDIEIGNTLFIDVTEAGDYTLYVTNTDINCTSSSTVKVSRTGGSVTAQISASSMFNCSNDTVVLDSEGSSAGPHVFYSWVDEAGNEIGNEKTLEVYDPGSYSLFVTDTLENCVVQKTVVLGESKNAPIIKIEGDSTLTCFKQEITLDAVIIEPDSNFLIEWKDMTGEVISQDLSLQVFESGNYTLIVTDSVNGCVSEQDIEISFTGEFPLLTIIDPGQLSCLVEEVVLDASFSSGSGELIFLWTTQNGSIIGPSDEAVIKVDEAGIYTLVVTNIENGCKSSHTVTVEEYDQAPIAIPILESDGNVLNSTAVIDNFYNEAMWDFGDGSFSDELETTHVYQKSGIYNVCLTLINDCGESVFCDQVLIDFNISLDKKFEPSDQFMDIKDPLGKERKPELQFLALNKNSEGSYQISPNPGQDQVTLSWKFQKSKDVELRIIDLSGKIFYSKEFIDCHEQQESLSIANWSEGIYIVQLITQEGIKHLQLVKQ